MTIKICVIPEKMRFPLYFTFEFIFYLRFEILLEH